MRLIGEIIWFDYRSCVVFSSKIFIFHRKRRHNSNSGIHEGFPGKCNVFLTVACIIFLLADASLEKEDYGNDFGGFSSSRVSFVLSVLWSELMRIPSKLRYLTLPAFQISRWNIYFKFSKKETLDIFDSSLFG